MKYLLGIGNFKDFDSDAYFLYKESMISKVTSLLGQFLFHKVLFNLVQRAVMHVS